MDLHSFNYCAFHHIRPQPPTDVFVTCFVSSNYFQMKNKILLKTEFFPWFSVFLYKIFTIFFPLFFPLQDYHVFFMHNPMPTRCLIFDLDTTLPFPTYFHKYVTETFRSDLALRPEHHRYVFGLMPALFFPSPLTSSLRSVFVYQLASIEEISI